MTEEEALALLESLTVAERKEIPLEDFAWPEERKYPCDTQDHVDACAKLLGHAPAEKQASIKARAIRIAKRHGFSIPDSWKEKQETTESAGQRPQKKIGTLPICWLEYNARSLNGRIYPKATCDAIFKAAQRVLSDPDALPPTTFVSHEAANGNVNTELVGGPRKVWQEGSKFWAHIDIADTSTAHNILGLVEGGYLKSGSMRVAGVELMHDRNYDLPLVVCQEGVEPQFLGIDLTTRPGLANIARIPEVLYESSEQEPWTESFSFESLPLEKEVPPAMPKLPTAYLEEAVSRFVLEGITPDRAAHQRIHDHLAGVLDSAVGECHGSESARLKAMVEAELTEAGRVIARKHAVTIAAAHDEAAKACGLQCEGCYKEALGMAPSDTDHDGDDPANGNDPDHDGESHKSPPALTESRKENKTLTEEEMIAALRAKGYTGLEAPKTEEQKKLAALEAQLAEQAAKLKELQEGAPTQRQTLANPSQLEESALQPEELYQEGDYLRGKLAPKNWNALGMGDKKRPRVPWPTELDPAQALHELAPFLAERLLSQEAASMGRDIGFFIGQNDTI